MRFILSLLATNLRDEALGQIYNSQQDPGETIQSVFQGPESCGTFKESS